LAAWFSVLDDSHDKVDGGGDSTRASSSLTDSSVETEAEV
jgi:hypothetical protein